MPNRVDNGVTNEPSGPGVTGAPLTVRVCTPLGSVTLPPKLTEAPGATFTKAPWVGFSQFTAGPTPPTSRDADDVTAAPPEVGAATVPWMTKTPSLS